MIDLGKWFLQDYRISSALSSDEEDIAEDESSDQK